MISRGIKFIVLLGIISIAMCSNYDVNLQKLASSNSCSKEGGTCKKWDDCCRAEDPKKFATCKGDDTGKLDALTSKCTIVDDHKIVVKREADQCKGHDEKCDPNHPEVCCTKCCRYKKCKNPLVDKPYD